MTNKELKMVLKLIDLRVTEKEVSRDQSIEMITGTDVELLKRDIKEMFQND